ncbi:MAG: copper chaperone PCu(A)C [Pseudomonadota bacterium]
MKFAVSLPIAVLMLSACSGEPAEEAATQSTACADEGVSVSGAWMRAARVGQPTSAAYLTLCNGSSIDDALVGVTFAGADAAELHVTNMDADGMASMTPSKSIPVPAGETARLEPGGAHVMLIGMQEAFAPGDKPTVTLEFESAPPATVELEVRDEAHDGGAHH